MSYFCHIYYCTKKKEENQKELSKRLLTYGFWHSFGISYEESMIERRSNGKPYYIGNENEIFFNLSHGQELIAVACADCEVGIDAESMRKVRENAMRRTCTRKEWEWLQQSEQKELDFLRLWTLKESYMKMTVRGMSLPLDSFEVVPTAEGFVLGKSSERPCFFETMEFDGYIFSVSSERAFSLHNPLKIAFDDIYV